MRQLTSQTAASKRVFELSIGKLMPAFFVISLLANYGLTQTRLLLTGEFAPVPLHALDFADYSTDPVQLSFPQVDPAIINDVKNVQPPAQEGSPQGGADVEGQGSVRATPTPKPAQPTASPTPPGQSGSNVTTPELPGAVENLPTKVPPIVLTVRPPRVPGPPQP